MIFYTHLQSTPATTWTVNHNLGHPPVVEVFITYNGLIQSILPKKITHTSNTTSTIEFSTARVGSARLF